MKIIDAHVHFSAIASFKDCAVYSSNLEYSKDGFLNENTKNNIVHSICMGLTESKAGSFPDPQAKTPMLADLAEDLPSSMSLCPGINPHTLNDQNLKELEEMIKKGEGTAGLKIYAGYYHFEVNDPLYDPVYNLAEKYDLPVAIHSGDTYSERALLSYAHPLKIDRLAVERRNMRIIICHMGAPWIFDACEVSYKNSNVFLDFSGLLTGNTAFVERITQEQLFLDRYKSALVFLDNYSKVLFGTDWPLTPMDAYIDFCKKVIPPHAYEDFFYRNAVNVYGLSGFDGTKKKNLTT